MGLPSKLVGAFRRSGLFLEGVRQVDYSDVIWLQTPDWFADMRLLVTGKAKPPTEDVPDWCYKEFAFAGVATWDDPRITWEHSLDESEDPPVDCNVLAWEDGVVVERGLTEVGGKEISFAEEWLRMTNENVDWKATPEDDRVRVEVGRFAIEVVDHRKTGGNFAARRFEKREGVWTLVGTVVS